MKYGERLAADGIVDQAEIATHVHRFDPNQLFQTDTYILKGQGLETWSSRFTYHGFQYVEVTGFPGRPTQDTLRGGLLPLRRAVAGRFECSNPLLNRIWTAARWSYLSNLHGIPTDCPHREKNGWTGDAHLAAEQALFNYFPAAVYTKWINDLADEQRPTGELPGIVPTSGWGYDWGNGPAWDSAFLLIPCYLYVYYGDTRDSCDHYDGMKRYVDYLTSKAKDGIVDIGLNDWAPFKTKTAGGHHLHRLLLSRRPDRGARRRAIGQDRGRPQVRAIWRPGIKKAFNARFYHPDTGLYGNGSQTPLSCALYQGLVEPAEQGARAEQPGGRRREDQRPHRHRHPRRQVPAERAARKTAAPTWPIASPRQKDLPSWGWWIEQGATTLWEQWRRQRVSQSTSCSATSAPGSTRPWPAST